MASDHSDASPADLSGLCALMSTLYRPSDTLLMSKVTLECPNVASAILTSSRISVETELPPSWSTAGLAIKYSV